MIEVRHRISRNEMIVTVWYLISDEHRTDSMASCCLFDCWAQFLRSLENCRIVRLRHISEVIYFALWDNQSVSESLWEYIEERVDILILVYPIWWDLSCDDASEKSGHSIIITYCGAFVLLIVVMRLSWSKLLAVPSIRMELPCYP